MNSNSYDKENDSDVFNAVKTKITTNLIYILLLLVVIIGEVFVRDILFSISTEVIIFLQQYLYFFSPFAKFFSFFGTEVGLVSVILISYNFLNNYQTLLLIITALTSAYIGGVLKLIYISPRPFMVSQPLLALTCEGGWGNPSNHALCSTCFYLSLYAIAIKPSRTLDNVKKTSILNFLIVFIIFIGFSRIFLGVHSINQVLYGCCLGVFLYYFLFNILEINPINSHELLNIIYSAKDYTIGILVLIILGLTPYFTVKPDPVQVAEWNIFVDQKCPGFPHAKKFEYESFMCIYGFSSIIPCILGNCVEFFCIFQSDVPKWTRYNFEAVEDKERNLIPIDIPEVDTKWNNTEPTPTLERIFIVIIVLCTLMIPHILVSYSQSFIMIITIKTLLPVYLVGFLIFSYLKTLLTICGCTNKTLFEEEKKVDIEQPSRLEMDRLEE